MRSARTGEQTTDEDEVAGKFVIERAPPDHAYSGEQSIH